MNTSVFVHRKRILTWFPNNVTRAVSLFFKLPSCPIALCTAALFGAKNVKLLVSFAISNIAWSMPWPVVELISWTRDERPAVFALDLNRGRADKEPGGERVALMDAMTRLDKLGDAQVVMLATVKFVLYKPSEHHLLGKSKVNTHAWLTIVAVLSPGSCLVYSRT
jgi:hypothetical protein